MATVLDAPAPMPAGGAVGAVPAPQHNASLYVGDLDRDVSEAQLYELFSQVGPIASIRVCRDAVTRRSLGYAYVNYNTALDPQAAERALESLNYAPINGRPLRIMWSHRDPSYRRSGVGNIFIKNLDKSIDHKALHDTFSQFGSILSCKVAVDSNGESKGYGFVHFETEEGAKLAIDKVNGMELADKIVYVGPFLKKNDRPGTKDATFTNVYVKNLADDVSEEDLKEWASQFGTVASVVVMQDDKGKSKGFGFVNFDQPESAAQAVDDGSGKELKGKPVTAFRAQKKAERETMLRQRFEEMRQERIVKYQGMNLYVKNLSDEIDDDRLREHFNPFGTVTSAKVMKDNTEKSRGFGFVCYTSNEEATRAVTEMNGKMVKGKPLYVALAQRKDVRRAQLEQQYNRNMAMAARQGGPTGPMPGVFPQGAPPPMYYPGRLGAQAARGTPGLLGYPQIMARGVAQGRGGRGPRGPPQPMLGPEGMMGPQQGLMMMGGGPVPRAGAGGRGGRGRGPQMKDGAAGGRGGRGGMARGMKPPQAMPLPPPGPAPPVPAPPPQPPLNVPPPASEVSLAAMLANATPDQQKQMLGERLFPQVQRVQPDLAGKITGMLLEMDNSEVLLLLENPEALLLKVDEAITVLKQHNAIPDGILVS